MLNMITIPVTSYEQNARLLMDESSEQAVLVDPGGDVPKIMSQLPKKMALTAIWITHSHIDHAGGVSDVIARMSLPSIDVIAHPDDKVNQDNLPRQSQIVQFPYAGEFSVTQPCVAGDMLQIGQYRFKVLHTPGHAIGHVSYFCDTTDNQYNAPICIAGDALFKGSIGRTDLPGGNHQQLLASIRDELFTLPPETVVCPGHGPNTTIGDEMKHNPFFS